MADKETLKKLGRATLEVSSWPVIAAKYGLELNKPAKSILSGANNMAKEFVGGGMNTNIGEEALDTTVKVADWTLSKVIQAQKAAKKALR